MWGVFALGDEFGAKSYDRRVRIGGGSVGFEDVVEAKFHYKECGGVDMYEMYQSDQGLQTVCVFVESSQNFVDLYEHVDVPQRIHAQSVSRGRNSLQIVFE
jgi:hypothetical protein